MSQSGSSTQQPTSSAVVPTTTASTQLVLPTDKTLQQACKLSLKTKKPICFYFYIDSLKGKISIVSDGEDRIIFKSEDEHTSPIINTYRSETCFIIETENTIYILCNRTPVKTN
jgi:hypothetical protein